MEYQFNNQTFASIEDARQAYFAHYSKSLGFNPKSWPPADDVIKEVTDEVPAKRRTLTRRPSNQDEQPKRRTLQRRPVGGQQTHPEPTEPKRRTLTRRPLNDVVLGDLTPDDESTDEVRRRTFGVLDGGKSEALINRGEELEKQGVQGLKAGEVRLTGNSYEVSNHALDEIKWEEEVLANAEEVLGTTGLLISKPPLKRGGRINGTGIVNFQKSHDWVANSPLISDGSDDIRAAIEGENRADEFPTLRDIELLDNGMLYVQGVGEIRAEVEGIKSLLQITGAFKGGAGYLADVDPELRAYNWQQRRSEMDLNKKVMLRIRDGINGERAVWTVRGENYGIHDGDEILGNIGHIFRGTGLRGEILYDPATSKLRVNGYWHKDHATDFASGSLFKIGVHLESDDRGGSSIKGWGSSHRNDCFNLIIISKGKSKPFFAIRHNKDSVADAQYKMRAGVKQIQAAMAPFLTRWGLLHKTDAREFFRVQTMEEALEVGMKDAGLASRTYKDKVEKAFNAEPGTGVDAVINALTRLHMERSISRWNLEKIERAAGELVPVYAKRIEASA